MSNNNIEEMIRQLEGMPDSPASLVRQLRQDWDAARDALEEIQKLQAGLVARVEQSQARLALIERHIETANRLEFIRYVEATIEGL